MRRIALCVVVMLWGGLLSIQTAAQGAPIQIEDALAAFNQRLGLNLTLNDFNWSWSQASYTDNLLGCPQPDRVALPASLVGYRFLFIWQGRIYEYRVSADRTILVFCGVSNVGEVPEEPALDPALSNSLCVVPNDNIVYIRTRLAVGVEGRVAPTSPSSLRALPSTVEAIIADLPVNATFRVLNGPGCDSEGIVWWEVAYENLQGWIAEGRERDYFVEPLPPAPLPTERPTITVNNRGEVAEVARLQGNYSAALAWSSSDELVVVGAAGSEGLWIYPLDQLSEAPRTLSSVTALTRVTFSASPNRAGIALMGDASGSLRLWDLAPGVGTLERLVLQGHDNPLTAVAFSPDGIQVASTGGYAYGTPVDETNNFAIVLWNIETVSQTRLLRGHTDEVVALAYSPDGALLASASLDGSVRVWSVLDGGEVGVLTGDIPATALTFAPDGRRLLTGWDDGAIIPISLGDFAVDEARVAHTGGVTGLAFSPDGALLASVGEDSRVMIWNEADLTAVTLPNRHNGVIYTVVFSPDGSLLATLGVDNSIRLWGVQAAEG